MAEPSLRSAPDKEENLYETQERSYCPEDKVVRLRSLDGSKLLLAESEFMDLLQQNRRAEKSSRSVAAQALKTVQGKTPI